MKIRYIVYLSLLVIVLVSCAAAPKPIDHRPHDPTFPPPPALNPPLWLTDTHRVYPPTEWHTAIEQGYDMEAVKAAATASLSQRYGTNLRVETATNEQLLEIINKIKYNTTAVPLDKYNFTFDISSSSAVEHSIEVEVETWTNPQSGMVYAIARTSRTTPTVSNKDRIEQVDRLIDQLVSTAAQTPRSFDAVQMLGLASKLAEINEKDRQTQAVFDPSITSSRPSYGSADALQLQAQNALSGIAINVTVDGDINNRVRRAFADYLNVNGFRTGAVSASQYILDARITFEQAGGNSIQYTLNYTLKDRDGVEILSKTETGREYGSLSEGRNRSIRAIETSIPTTGFAESFTAFLEALYGK